MTKIQVQFSVNGQERRCEAYPLTRLLDVLRQDLGLLGTKEGCGEGECGACSVLVDGHLVTSCLMPVAQAEGAAIVTIEGHTREEGVLHPVQEAFVRLGAAQCGICTPGMVLASVELLARNPNPSEDEVRQGLAGNLCRCTGYVKIVEAVCEAARHMNVRGSDA